MIILNLLYEELVVILYAKQADLLQWKAKFFIEQNHDPSIDRTKKPLFL